MDLLILNVLLFLVCPTIGFRPNIYAPNWHLSLDSWNETFEVQTSQFFVMQEFLNNITSIGDNISDIPSKKKNRHQKILGLIRSYLDNSDELSSCLNDVSITFNNATKAMSLSSVCASDANKEICNDFLTTWSVRLIDSLPHIPSGITQKGPFFFLGDFDLCQSIQKEKPPVGVHYCRINTKAEVMGNMNTPITFGLCLPRTCSSAETLHYLSDLSSLVYSSTFSLEIANVECTDENSASSTAKLVLTIILACLGSLVIIGSFVDYAHHNRISFLAKPTETEYERVCAGKKNNENDATYADDAPTVAHFGAPSIALTYKSMPAIKESFSRRTAIIDILRSFSLRISVNHLFRNSAREIPCLNGIKVFSAIWVIIGHSCLFCLPYMDNVRHFITTLSSSSFLSPLLLNSSLAVDSFLFISGTVVAYTVRKRMIFREQNNTPFSGRVLRLFLFYFHRAFRLWPTLLITMAFFHFIYNHLGDGPMWSTNGIFGTVCPASSIWPHLVFLSNWFPSHCLPWLWHVSVDFQLYLCSPLLLYLLPKWRRPTVAFCLLLILSAIIYQTIVYSIYTMPANLFVGMLSQDKLENAETAFRLLYASPLARSPPFIIGLLTGWFICVRRAKPFHFGVLLAIKACTFLFIYYALFSPFSMEGPASYIHAVSHRTVWALSLALLVWLCEHGELSTVAYILSSHRLLPVARLSFGIYLTHEPILLYLIWTSRQALSPLSFSFFLLLALVVAVLALMAAFVIAVAIEIPMLTMERKLLKKTERRFNRKQEEDENSLPDIRDQFGIPSCVDVEKASLWLNNSEIDYKEIIAHLPVSAKPSVEHERYPDEIDCEPPSSDVSVLTDLSYVERNQLSSSRC